MQIIEVENGVPIYSWAVNAEEGAIEQASNLARLPFAIDHVALMPDAHHGYGMPIGGVLFAKDHVVPYAVGVDIGCGVKLLSAEMTAFDLSQDFIDELLRLIQRDIPTGNGPSGGHRTPQGEPFNVLGPISQVAHDAIIAADLQLGTLGGGNHFLELQRSESGGVYFMLHSGSRSVGKKICDHYHRLASKYVEDNSLPLPHPELAYLRADSRDGSNYLVDMGIAMAWAEENRRRMAGKVISAFGTQGVKVVEITDVHHNYASYERHELNEFGYTEEGIVHRKGAVRAAEGEIVLIPGSMGTSSWIAEGLGNDASFRTCQHGAGRLRSRGATRRLTTVEEMNAQLESVNVTLLTKNREAVIDESTVAYKSIDEVMEASSDLITPVRQLFPVGVVKG